MKCHDCDLEIFAPEGSIATGYAVTSAGEHICYACAGARDREAMTRDGRATLYLTQTRTPNAWNAYKVTNWPGTAEFPVRYHKTSRHNWGLTRTDVWFRGPDARVWHGVQIGDNTQIVHCKRTKERWT